MLTRPIFCWCWVMNESYQACFSFSYFAYKLIICKPHKWSQIGASVDGWISGFGLTLFNCFPSLTKFLSLLGGKKNCSNILVRAMCSHLSTSLGSSMRSHSNLFLIFACHNTYGNIIVGHKILWSMWSYCIIIGHKIPWSIYFYLAKMQDWLSNFFQISF